jgi:hypothetical protein
MNFRPCLSLLALAAVLVGANPNLEAQSAATLDALIKQRDAAIRQLHATTGAQKADLFDKYANALDALTRQFTAKGDLDSLLIVRNEIESARTQRALSSGVLPALEAYRAALRKGLEGIEAGTATSQSQLDAGYLRSLNQMKVEFTKAGRIDDAISVDKEIKNVTAGTAPSATASATSPAKVPTPAPPEARPPAGAKTVDFEKPIAGEVTLSPMTYRPRNQVQVGNRQDKQNGTLQCPPGTQFDGASLFADLGLISADHVIFKECKLFANLAGTFQAKDSLFSECEMHRGGAWFVAFYSTKWIFENCAFTHSFFTAWSTHNQGLKINRCTFHDVEFVPITYTADAGKEAVHDWFTISHCKFIGCSIPEAFFIATKDCVFEDCRFVAAKDKEKLPIVTPIKLRAYVSDPAKVPPAPANCTYDLLDLKAAPKDMGAELRYQRAGRALKFQ